MAEQTVGNKKEEADKDDDPYFCDVCNITFDVPKVNNAQLAILRNWCCMNAG